MQLNLEKRQLNASLSRVNSSCKNALTQKVRLELDASRTRLRVEELEKERDALQTQCDHAVEEMNRTRLRAEELEKERDKLHSLDDEAEEEEMKQSSVCEWRNSRRSAINYIVLMTKLKKKK